MFFICVICSDRACESFATIHHHHSQSRPRPTPNSDRRGVSSVKERAHHHKSRIILMNAITTMGAVV